jgi:RNA polymerase sigma-70 factor, ECF subfamily
MATADGLRREEGAMQASFWTHRMIKQKSEHRGDILALDDEDLIRRISRRDAKAMQILYARHGIPVFRFLLCLLGDIARAELLTAEVFTEAWNQSERFDRRSAVSTWLLAIAYGKAATHTLNRPDDANGSSAAVAETDTPPADATQMRTGRADQARHRDHPSIKDRAIVELVYLYRKSLDEVAVILRISREAASWHMVRARNRVFGSHTKTPL